jgi:site-specific recombinase XerC
VPVLETWGELQATGLLGHTQLATTQRYAHLDLDPRRRAVELVASQIDQFLGNRSESRGATDAN